MSSSFKYIQKWYTSQCDGDWEHQHGVSIDTLDNSGWSVKIDLYQTELENKKFEEIKRDSDGEVSTNWVNCKVEDYKFIGYGGIKNLEEIFDIFKKFAK